MSTVKVNTACILIMSVFSSVNNQILEKGYNIGERVVSSGYDVKSAGNPNNPYIQSETYFMPGISGSGMVNAAISAQQREISWDMQKGRTWGELNQMALIGPLGYVTGPEPTSTTRATKHFTDYESLSRDQSNSMNLINEYQWSGPHGNGIWWW